MIPVETGEHVRSLLTNEIMASPEHLHVRAADSTRTACANRLLPEHLDVMYAAMYAAGRSSIEIEPLTQEEARRILDVTDGRRNGVRWSVGLALGLRQGEALGLRWKYVDLEAGVVRVWWQVSRANWWHGCADPHACGKQHHRAPCAKRCTTHRHRADCPAGLYEAEAHLPQAVRARLPWARGQLPEAAHRRPVVP
ncbi:MAG TPA: hypothetical protein VGL93_16490 [Streptosporangiaceae bacterium]|jgi:hypothetical protein